ncbi:hypothetical protein ACG3K5_004635, partial [Escherichia coli]
VTLKMPAFEWVHVQLHQQKGMISLSPPTICNSANGTAIPSADCAGVDVNASPAERTREFFLFFSVCLFN